MTQTLDVLVDLDGTLIDPRAGIIGSVQHALRTLGLAVPPAGELEWVIGPPMRQSFPALGVPAAKVEEAIAFYRARYQGGAMHDARVYDGVPGALDALRVGGARLILATSKPHAFARPILERQGLKDRFAALHGAELDGRNDDKGDLIAHIIAAEGVDPRRAVMVGDRRFDVLGAGRHHIPCVGVLWGYGSRAELEEAGASALCEHPQALADAVLRTVRGTKGSDSP